MRKTSGAVRLLGVLLFLLTIRPAGSVRADGGMFFAPDREMFEYGQVAVIHHRDGVESLKILPKFRGNSPDFAWLVPVPGLPEVDVAEVELFRQATYLTRPVNRHRDGNGFCSPVDEDMVGIGQPAGVEVVSNEVIGIYRTLVIAAQDASALTDSLAGWGFLHEDVAVDAARILASYVERDWCFVAMKVDSIALAEAYPYREWEWIEQMQPVELTFASDEPVYPLQISSLSAAPETDVVLYTISDHRLTFDEAETWYANRISASELREIQGIYPTFGAELTAGDFLTKLIRRFTPEEMDEDLVLIPAADDDEFRPVNYSGVPLFNGLLAGSVLGWICWRRIRRRKSGGSPK